MSKKLIFLIILLTVFGLSVFNSKIIEKVEADSAGPVSPGFAENSPFGGIDWLNPGNVYTSNNIYASITLPSSSATNYIKATGFDFSIIPDSSTIIGIEVRVEKKASAASSIYDNSVKIVKGGSVVGSENASSDPWLTGNETKVYGASNYLWGISWIVSDIKNPGFGVVISAANDTISNKTVYIDHIQITVYYSVPASPPTVETIALTYNISNTIHSYGAVLTGTITDTGGVNADKVGFDIGTSPGNYIPSLETLKEGGSFGAGDFSLDVNGLSPDTTYYFRAKAHNSAGWNPIPAEEQKFKTLLTPNLHGFAWSANIGWISFNSDNCDVDKDGKYEGATEGGPFPVPGWTPAPAGCPTFGSVKKYGVYSRSGTFYSMRGYAWSENIGWIRLSTDTSSMPGPSGVWCGDFGWIRVCSGNSSSGCVIYTNQINPEAGGWSGYICLEGIGGSNFYKVELVPGVDPDPDEYKGWAWGGGGTGATEDEKRKNALIGWISFNYKNCDINDNGFIDLSCNGDDSTTPNNNYKVTYKPVNEPPVIEAIDSSIDDCAYGAALPADFVAQGTTLTIDWGFTDDDPIKYEVDIGDENPISSPKFNYEYIVPLGDPFPTLYKVKLGQDLEGDWLDHLEWRGAGDIGTYYYRVCITDSINQERCSDTGSFEMHYNASPKVNFNIIPERQQVFKNVNFCSINGSNDDGSGICGYSEPNNQPPVPPTQCFNSLNDPVDCVSWSWKFEHAVPPLTSNKKNPFDIKFQLGPSQTVRLEVADSDYSCSMEDKVTIGLPLPLWREISPSF